MDKNIGYSSGKEKRKAVLGIFIGVSLLLLGLAFYSLLPRIMAVLKSDTGHVSVEENHEGKKTPSDTETEESSDDTPVIDVHYTVRCVDEDGEILQEKVYTGTAGDDVSVTAPTCEGFVPTPERQERTLSSDEADNTFVFYYDAEDAPAETKPNIPAQNVLYYNGHTYYAYRTTGIDSYWEAANYAESCGGYLAVITDGDENRAVYDYVFDELRYESAYFGLTDDGFEGDWYWIDGSAYEYENWAAGQPDNLGGNENYALFWHGDRAYRWNDGDFGKDAAGTVTFLIEWDTQ